MKTPEQVMDAMHGLANAIADDQFRNLPQTRQAEVWASLLTLTWVYKGEPQVEALVRACLKQFAYLKN